MHLSTFLTLLAKELYPVLHAEGFQGSGTTLRRIREPVIHVFNVQGSSNGNRCYLNLAAHLSFLPTEGGGDVPAKSLRESHSVFRDRIDPPDGQPGWSYGVTHEEAARQVECIAAQWTAQGRPFFQRYADYPASFLAILTDALSADLHGREALHYARIARHLGQTDSAAAFARRGLEGCPEKARSLRAELEKLLRELKTAT